MNVDVGIRGEENNGTRIKQLLRKDMSAQYGNC